MVVVNASQNICDVLPSELSPNRSVEFAIGTASIILNSTIIYFIIFKTPKDLKDYRIYLFLITVKIASFAIS
jgi:hypothetical protein